MITPDEAGALMDALSVPARGLGPRGTYLERLSERVIATRACLSQIALGQDPRVQLAVLDDKLRAWAGAEDEQEDEPEPEDYDPGPECDDEGGMSEYRYAGAEDYPL